MSITSSSTNGLKEYRNYLWETDRDGHILNIPQDLWNHFLDAARYGRQGLGVLTYQEPLEIIGYEMGLGNVEIPIYS